MDGVHEIGLSNVVCFPYVLYIAALTLNHENKVFYFISEIRVNGTCIAGRKNV